MLRTETLLVLNYYYAKQNVALMRPTPGSRLGWGRCVMFLSKTPLSRCLSPDQMYNGEPAHFMLFHFEIAQIFVKIK